MILLTHDLGVGTTTYRSQWRWWAKIWIAVWITCYDQKWREGPMAQTWIYRNLHRNFRIIIIRQLIRTFSTIWFSILKKASSYQVWVLWKLSWLPIRYSNLQHNICCEGDSNRRDFYIVYSIYWVKFTFEAVNDNTCYDK